MFLQWLQFVRVHQWVKNILVFVPLVTAHAYSSAGDIILAVVCFVAFCCAASASYVLNDYLDVDHDSLHPFKKKRALASGAIPLVTAGLVGVSLFIGALIISLQLSLMMMLIVFGYCLLSGTYSLFLKKYLLLDVFVLALLYTIRIAAGAFAISVPLSFWLLAFSMFLFLSLAFLKRFIELNRFEGEEEALPGRGYQVSDREIVLVSGVASGYIAVLVFALYINSQVAIQLYGTPWFLWVTCLVVLFWVSRVWMAGSRGQAGDDPVLFAVRDPQSLVCAVLVAASFWLAL